MDVHWRKDQFFKTELELGQCCVGREGPCECISPDLRQVFVTTGGARTRRGCEPVEVELTLVRDADEQGGAR